MTTSVEALAQDGLRRVGVLLDAGAPDGIGVSAVVRPIEWLRLNAGVTTNTLSMGVRGGVSLVPFSTIVSPTLNADVGHYFDARYSKLIDRLGGSPLREEIPIEDVAYNYASASVGLEVGSPNRFSFYLRAGLSYCALTVDDAEKLLQDVANDPDITMRPLDLHFTTPSVKAGFLLYFF